jgi:hypothetical protein
MAMIEVDLREFAGNLIVEKSAGHPIGEAERARITRDLLAVLDAAVDVAIMNAFMRMALDRVATTAQLTRLYDLIRAGSKTKTEVYVRRVLPDLDEVIAAELVKARGMYLRGVGRSRDRKVPKS